FAVLNTLHRAHAHLFQRLMIQLSRVVFSHADKESIMFHAVKQNIELLMNGLIHGPRDHGKPARACRGGHGHKGRWHGRTPRLASHAESQTQSRWSSYYDRRRQGL